MVTRTTISLLQLGPVIFGGTDGIISFLQGKGLLAQQLTCHRCSVAMNIARRACLTDGHAFWCPKCHIYTSLRSGSFFDKSRLPLQKWILLTRPLEYTLRMLSRIGTGKKTNFEEDEGGGF